MHAPSLPADEDLRLEALRQLCILDTEAEERYDRITRLACDLFEVPICLVSLVDADRQWFKSKQGLTATQTPRDLSFCGHAILGDRTLVVEDALEDQRFHDNPLVVGAPNVRFYAGHPLRTREGHKIGTLCLIDHEPRELDGRQRAVLMDLAAVVESEIRVREIEEMRRATQREIAEHVRALRAANDEIRRAAQVKERFLASMSHEIRSPMSAILGFVDLLDDESLDASTRREYVGTIQRNGSHLLALLNDILDLSKVEAGLMRVERATVDLPAMLTDVLRLQWAKAEESRVALAVELQSPVPRRITSDPVRLRQILINLLGNAVKFAEGGRVVLRAGVDGGVGRLRLAVEDDGIGMSPEQLERLFQPFRQAEASTARRFGGTGLGLAISQQLAGLLGGRITVESEEGAGSVFALELPVTETDLAECVDELELPRLGRERAGGSMQGRVLVVDDDAVNRMLLSKMLEASGVHAELREDGVEAVETVLGASAAGMPYDLVLMDMVMPRLDGFAATGELRAQGYRGVIVALTGHAGQGDRERCLKAGCDDYLSKPVDRVALRAVLARHLRAEPEPVA